MIENKPMVARKWVVRHRFLRHSPARRQNRKSVSAHGSEMIYNEKLQLRKGKTITQKSTLRQRDNETALEDEFVLQGRRNRN
jgi:hypothetical protein